MSDAEKCPPYPHVHELSWASGSNSEYYAKERWEAKWGNHPDAIFARLEPVPIHAAQLAVYRDTLRQHLETEGARRLTLVAPNHLHALIEAAARVEGLEADVIAARQEVRDVAAMQPVMAQEFADERTRAEQAEARATAAEAQLAEMGRLVNEAAALRGTQPPPTLAPGLLEHAARKAAAELRHAYRAHGLGEGPIDPNLLAKAIRLLEEATNP